MSLIVCDQKCRHQKEGYCCLEQISHLTSDTNATCGYFEAGNAERELSETPSAGILTQNSQGL